MHTVQTSDFSGDGWAPIAHMAELLTGYLGTSIELIPHSGARWFTMLRTRIRRPPPGAEGGAVYITSSPREILDCLAAPAFRKPQAFRCLWIIDSFWTEQLPPSRYLRDFDQIIYSQVFDRDFYEGLVGKRAYWLPWGTDAMRHGSGGAERPIDILRVGRQPAAWEDDEESMRRADARGIAFHGRPPGGPSIADLFKLMNDWYGRSKYVLAQTNQADPTTYTHPEKEYITARWTDALASGAGIAGIAPSSDLDILNWPGAILDFSDEDPTRNFDEIQAALEAWTPDQALRNHWMALQRLDWRWRFKTLAEILELSSPSLDRDLVTLQGEIERIGAMLNGS